MTNVNIISGFLGSGKTTFLRKIIPIMKGQTVLIENEFSEAGLDGEFMKQKLPTKEIYSGCICCSLSGDFTKAIEELYLKYKPKNIMIEPSGVANITDIIKSFNRVGKKSGVDIKLNYLINIVDLSVFNDYIDNFGSFYINQIKNSKIIFLSHFDKVSDVEIKQVIKKIKDINSSLHIIKEDWYLKTGEEIMELLDSVRKFEVDIDELSKLSSTNIELDSHAVFEPRKFYKDELKDIPVFLREVKYSSILRAKGVLHLESGELIYFDYTPSSYSVEYLRDIRESKIAIIGKNLNEEKLNRYFMNVSGGYDE